MRRYLPPFIKSALRFVYYKQQRAKVFREFTIRKEQNKLIKQCDFSAKKLVVFLVGGADWDTGTDKISGGAISVVSLCEESAKLKDVHGAEVIMCTVPQQHLLLKHTQFENNTNIFRFSQLKENFSEVEEILLHLPEFMCSLFMQMLHKSEVTWLKSLKKVHINIMNQNIKLMPSKEEVARLKNYASLVTATTAHEQYCNRYYREFYNIPLHKFSVWISPENYSFRQYSEKQNVMIVSPDNHPMREQVLEKLYSIKDLKVTIIQNLTYEQYKATIANAKWALTFGEGLDGYIIEPVFSGSVGFAVYNDEFFTPDFAELKTVYSSYETMLSNIVNDIKLLDNEASFVDYNKKQFDLCARQYSKDQYRKNIAAFYRGEFTYK